MNTLWQPQWRSIHHSSTVNHFRCTKAFIFSDSIFPLLKLEYWYFTLKCYLYCKCVGGPLTITDANLCLNRLLPNYFPKIFGKTQDRPLDTKATMKAFENLTKEVLELFCFSLIAKFLLNSIYWLWREVFLWPMPKQIQKHSFLSRMLVGDLMDKFIHVKSLVCFPQQIITNV